MLLQGCHRGQRRGDESQLIIKLRTSISWISTENNTIRMPPSLPRMKTIEGTCNDEKRCWYRSLITRRRTVILPWGDEIPMMMLDGIQIPHAKSRRGGSALNATMRRCNANYRMICVVHGYDMRHVFGEGATLTPQSVFAMLKERVTSLPSSNFWKLIFAWESIPSIGFPLNVICIPPLSIFLRWDAILFSPLPILQRKKCIVTFLCCPSEPLDWMTWISWWVDLPIDFDDKGCGSIPLSEIFVLVDAFHTFY